MKNLFIFHGSFGSPYENWFPWLFNYLSENKLSTIVPFLPTPYGQSFENWGRILDAYVTANILTKNSIIVCHSSSSVFILKYAKSRNLVFNFLITVSGFNNFFSGNSDFDKINAEFYLEDAELTEASKAFKNRHSFFSNTDPYIPKEVLENFCANINSETHFVHAGGHFNTLSGYNKFEELIQVLNVAIK